MWSRTRTYFASAKIYFKEIIFFDLFLFLLLILISDSSTTILFFSICFILLSLLLLLFIGRKRNKELNEIKDLLNKIRTSKFISADELSLSKDLLILQEEIKKTFEKMKGDIEYLRKLERMRTEFIANVSHELRTPIFTIQGYLETLLDGAIHDEKVNQNFLRKAVMHTLNLNSLLNDLIDISMIESGELRMSFRYFNLSDYMKNIIEEFKPKAAEKKIELNLLPFRENLQLYGDKNKLKQVFNNLIANAINYTESGKVEVRIEEESNFGKISVSDTGIGIDEKTIAHIFERFYRVDNSRSREAGGTGLGLAIVKHIIEAHGSKIEVKSKLGEGTEFSFRLKK